MQPENMNTPGHYAELLSHGFLEPVKIGPKHLLFSKEMRGGLMSEIVSPSQANLKLWEGSLERLITIFVEWSSHSPLWTFGVVEHDGCFAEIVWPHKMDLQKFVSADLAWLQTLEVSDSPLVQVGIITAAMDWLVLFERRSGLEIAFYGPEKKWADLGLHLSALATPFVFP